MEILVFIVIVLYTLTLVVLCIFFFKNKDKNAMKYAIEHTKKYVSILVSVRNESLIVEKFLNQFENINFPYYELVIVNDHSEDNTVEVIENLNLSFVKVLNLPKNLKGKKNALKYGLQYCKGDWIVFTDADTIVNSNWLGKLNIYFEKADMLLAPVLIKNSAKKSFVQLFENLDVLALQFLTYISVKAGFPFIASGANMAIKKELAIKLYNNINTSICSGDDVFLLHEAIKSMLKIDFVTDNDSVVFVEPNSTWKNFIKQRIRWASKTIYYKNITAIFFSWLIFLIHFLPVLFGFCFIIGLNFENKLLYFISLAIKFIIDVLFLSKGLHIFNQSFSLLRWFPLVWILYFFYISFVPIMALFFKISWKNRTWS